jgi:solute carrier family 35 protein E3
MLKSTSSSSQPQHHRGDGHHHHTLTATIVEDVATDCTYISHHTAQVGYLAFNFVSSVVTAFINDAIFSKIEFGFPAYLCLNGFIISFFCTEIVTRCFGVSIEKNPTTTTKAGSKTLSSSTKQQQQQQQAINKLPTLCDPNFILLILVVGLSKTFSNATLKNNSMGVYQLFKLLVTPFVVLLEFGLDGKRLSYTRILWLTSICVFVWLCVKGDMSFTLVGLLVRFIHMTEKSSFLDANCLFINI